MSIFESDPEHTAGPVSYEEYLLLKKNADPFEWIGAAHISPATMGMVDRSVIVSVAAISPKLATIFELPLGNGVTISYRMWRDEFAGATDIRGKQIRIKGIERRVIGVAPKWLEGLYRDRSVDIWMVYPADRQWGIDHGGRDLWILAQLRHNVSASQAQGAVRQGPNALVQIRVLPYTGMTPQLMDSMADVTLLLDFAAGGVFFIACVNIFSLLLGRAFARSHETAIRVALGASRGQLAAQLLWDSAVISITGGLCSVLFSIWTARVVPAFLFERDAEHLLLRPSLLSIVMASTACAGVTILCGFMPFFLEDNSRPATVLRREGIGPSRSINLLRRTLIVTQMTSCCILVFLTVFLLDGFRSALQARSGRRFKDAILITAQAEPYNEKNYFQHVDEITRSTGIVPIAWAARLPGSQAVWQSFRIDPRESSYHDILLDTSWFTVESLQHIARLPTAGRLFGFGDERCRVAVVNEQAAAKLFGRENAVGRIISDSMDLRIEIIGVVAEIAGTNGQVSRPTIYYNAADETKPKPERIALESFRAPVASKLVGADLDTNVVSTAYFESMGFSLTSGSGFTNSRIADECRIAVLNEEAADLYFGGKRAVGSAVIDDRGVRTTIIGIVHSHPFGIFQRRSEPAIYFPMSQDCLRRMTLIAVNSTPEQILLADLRRTVESVPGRGPAPVVIDKLSSHLARTALAPLRITTVVFAASAITGLLLSIFGLFGVVNDAARHRRREMAIRTALGAQPWRIFVNVLQEGGRLACAGAVTGTLGALALSRLLVRIMPDDRWPSFLTWLVAPPILAAIVIIASLLPARRVVAPNTLSIMRDE